MSNRIVFAACFGLAALVAACAQPPAEPEPEYVSTPVVAAPVTLKY